MPSGGPENRACPLLGAAILAIETSKTFLGEPTRRELSRMPVVSQDIPGDVLPVAGSEARKKELELRPQLTVARGARQRT